jgi:N-acetylglutamate synthase-like GNAT family acetyltransferase
VQVRRATDTELPDVLRLYAAWQYSGEVRPEDAIFIAEQDGCLIGVVRLVAEGGTTVLRGMRVQPDFQRQRIGSRLLDAAVAALGRQECYCIPYAHLVDFYGRAGFVTVASNEAPAFLAERLERYRQRGPAEGFLIMHRPGRTESA